MSSFKWVKVNRDQLNREPRKEEIAGVLVDVYFASYDMPEKIGGAYDKSKQQFVIKFDYLDADEPIVRESRNQHIDLCVGKKSRRLYEVEIDVDNMGADQVELNIQKVDEAIKKYMEDSKSKPANYVAVDNYLAASGALEFSRNDLVRELSAAE
jgi:hypothetical protein